MKKIFMALLMPFFAHAAILDANSTDQAIYMHPTPTLEVNLMDLGNDGGILTVSLNYISATTKAEISDLQLQYPDKEIQVIMAEPQYGIVTFAIPEIGLQQDFPLQQGQMGPYLNNQVALTKDQMKKALALKSQLADLVQFPITAKANYLFTHVVEEYTASSNICSTLKINTVKDLVLSLGRLQKPNSIQYSQTFEAFKGELLDHCFVVHPSPVNSFKELLNLPITTSLLTEKITGQYVEKKSQSKVFSLNPHIKIELN